MASIADVYVTVLPETGKIASGIEKALRDVDVKAIAEAWKAKIEQILKGIEANVDIKVDSAKAKAEIERATKDKKATVEVDVDGAAKAEAEIDAVSRDRKTKIKVDVDKGAGAGILGLATNLTAQGFTAVSSGAQAAAQGMNIAGTAAGTATTQFASVSKSTAALGVALVALVPLMGAVAGVAAAMAGALALLPAAFSAVGAGAGVLMVGLSGITDAYEAVSGAAKSAGKDAKDHASKVTSASRSVTSAQQSLTSAVRSERQAQQDVARARRDALHELQDINDELRNGAIDETQANLDLAKARQELATGTFDSSLDYQQAQLNVIKAEQRAKEAHEQNAQTQQDANDKQAKGVEGADAVVAAEQRLADAQQQTANAQTALIDAQTQLAEANNEVSTSAQKAADAMGGLSPNAQALVNTLVGLQPVWEQFRNSLQDPLTANLGPTITNAINTVLPAVQPGLVRIAEAFNAAFQGIGEWLQNPENVAMIQTIVNNIAAAFEQLKPAVQPLLTILGTLTAVGSDFLPGFAHAISDAVTQFSNFITEAQKSGDLQQFIMKAVFAFQELGKLMPTIIWAFGRFADMGVQVLPGLVDAINLIVKAIGFIAPAFVAPFDALHKLVEFANWARDKWQDFTDWFGRAWNAAGDIITQVWDQKMKPFFSKIIEGVNWVIRGLNKLPLVDIPEIDVPAWYSGGGGSFDSGLPSAAPGSDVSPSRSENRTSTAGGPPVVAAPPGGPAPVVQPGGSAIPGGAPGQQPSTSDGTRVFVTNWPAGGVGGGGGGGGSISVTGAPGAPVGPTPGGGVPVIPDPNRPGFFTSTNPEWAKLIKRESGGAPAVTQSIQDANSAAGTPATGLFQITTPTWLSNGGGEFAPTAREATPEQQGVVAARIFAARGGQPWGAVAGGGREDEAALRAGLAPGSTPTMPSPAGPPGVVGGGARVPYGLAPGSDSGGYGGTGVQFPAWTGAVTQQFGVKPSTYPGHQEGQSHAGEPGYAPNPQGLNRGIDWKGTPAQMRALAEWAMQNPGAFEQLIYWDPETGKKYGIAGGKDVTNTGYYENKEGYPAHGGPGNLAGAHVHTRQSMSWGPGAGDANTGITGSPNATGPIALSDVIPPGQQAKGKDSAKGYGKDLGQDIVSGMMEIFGLGDIFPDPTQFGIFKIFKSLLAIKPGGTSGAPNGGPTNATDGSGSGGDPLMDLLGSIIPNANGTGGLAGLGAWQPPPGSPASGQGPGAPPGPVTNNNVVVQGNIDNPTLNKVDTQHTSDLRNIPGR